MKRDLLCVCGAVFLLATASRAAAQSAERPRFGASAAIGVSRPSDAAMTGVYGTSLMSVAGQFDVHVAAGVSMFGGLKWVQADGRTVVVGTPVAGEDYATSLRMISYRFGALAARSVATRWAIAGGGGVSITSYKEDWPDAALTVSDQSTGFLAFGEVRYRFAGRWSATLRVEYVTIPAKAGSTDVNLGGIDLQGGLHFGF